MFSSVFGLHHLFISTSSTCVAPVCARRLRVTHVYGKQQQAAISSQSICQLPSLTSTNQCAALWVTGRQHSPGVSNRSHSVCRFPCHGTHGTDGHPTILSVWCHRVSHQIRPGGQLAECGEQNAWTSDKPGVSGLATSSSSDFCFFIWREMLFTLRSDSSHTNSFISHQVKCSGLAVFIVIVSDGEWRLDQVTF